MTAQLTGPAPTIQRDRWGRPLIQPRPGEKPVPYTRATTVAGAIDDKNGLILWKQRLTALGLTQRQDLYTAVAASSPDDKQGLNRIVEQAAEHAGASQAATTGTALHAFTERLDRGENLTDIGAPAEHHPALRAYQQATAGWEVLAIEQFTVLHAYKIAGTADRIVRIDGKNYIADLKTGSSIAFHHAYAAQLAIYARSLPYNIDTGETGRWEFDPPDRDRGLIIHMPAGKNECTLHWIDISTEGGWHAVRMSMDVRTWRSRRDLITPYTPGGDTPPTDPVTAAIEAAVTVNDLTAIWQQHQNVWTDAHTAAAAARKNSLQATA